MNLNLATPYDDASSPPRTPYLAFFSRRSPDLLFAAGQLEGDGSIEILCQAGLRSVALQWSLHHNLLLQPFRRGPAQALPAGQFRIQIPAGGLAPGFYDLRVSLDSGLGNAVAGDSAGQPGGPARPVTGVCTFGWRVDEMALCETRPEDFRSFWDQARAELAALPVDGRGETAFQVFTGAAIGAYNLSSAGLPADYDPDGHRTEVVASAKVSFAGPDGGRVYGWLAKPPGEGPFPAMLILPGAGFNARPRPLEHARHGYVALDVQVHGQDVDQAEYLSLDAVTVAAAESAEGDPTAPRHGSPQAHYYYKVHQRVVAALNYLAARPDVDASRVVVVGGSQGGRLGIVAAGLDRRVAALVSCIAHAGNYPQLAWTAHCNGLDQMGDDPNKAPFKDRLKSDGTGLQGAPPLPVDDFGRTAAYYDPMNFASDITCPVLMNAGLIDPVSPAFGVWGIYNRLTVADKTIVPLPGLGHDWCAEFDRRAWRWLAEKLGNLS